MSLGYYSLTLTLENYSGVPMEFETVQYDHGQIDDYSEWPRHVAHNAQAEIVSRERGWSVFGVSGYAVYKMQGTPVTIAFAVPPVGVSKVAVGTASSSSVFAGMKGHGDEEYAVQVAVGSHTHLNVACQVNAGWIAKEATVKLYKNRD